MGSAQDGSPATLCVPITSPLRSYGATVKAFQGEKAHLSCSGRASGGHLGVIRKHGSLPKSTDVQLTYAPTSDDYQFYWTIELYVMRMNRPNERPAWTLAR
jgi:hypothetical protein